ncbi:MAG: c-type cytochrome [Candidatus Eremiobacteraeota bacterium]|nr:c-type cytochrome [Candidatus Eremiobacteraeota bacterium]MBV8354478.1 c-type cytochrome [Candidatus Eremiobacteraeota bacterium]
MTGGQYSGWCSRRWFERVALPRNALAYLIAAAAFGLLAASAAPAARADAGADIFTSKCAACHTIGKGKTVGPDLKGITSQAPHDFLVKWIMSPSALVKAGDPTATALVKQYPLQMPDLGLSQSDVEAVLTYIQTQSGGAAAGGAAAAPAAPAQAMPPGDATRGRELFVGGVRLQAGGPPCMSCHSISGIGALGGGTLGPDLTNAYQKYGGTDAGLAQFLTGTPTPTMNAVWSKHPLTAQEIADLTAFVKQAALATRSPDAFLTLAILAVVALIVFALIIASYWRRRLLSVRISLVTRANGGVGQSMDFTRRLTRRA